MYTLYTIRIVITLPPLTFHVHIIYHSNSYYTATSHFPRALYIPFKWLLHCHLSLSTCTLYTIQMVITLPPLTFHVHIIYHSNGYYTATSHFPHTHYIPFKWLLHCHLSLSTCTLYTIQMVITLPPLTFHVHIIYHSNGYYTATSHFPRAHYIPFKWLLHCHLSLSTCTLYTIQMVITLPPLTFHVHIIYHSNGYYTASTYTLYTIQIVITRPPLTFHVHIIYHSNSYYTATAHFPRTHYIPFKWLLHCHLSLSTCTLYTIQIVITLPPLTFHVHIIYHSNGYYTATSHFPRAHYIPFK